jgi:hypothetical protein
MPPKAMILTMAETWSPRTWAALVWLVLCGICCVRAFLFPTSHTVYHNYANAGRCWLQGQDAYDIERDVKGAVVPHMSGYRYAPLVSVLMVPFSVLPDSLGGVLWRLLNYGCFFTAFACFMRQVLPGGDSFGERAQAILWFLLIPLSLGSINNGQANVLLVGLLLGAATAVVQERWNLAAGLLAGACVLKIYPLALALLFMMVYPRQLGWRFALALGFGVAVPFAFQRPGYVLEQYENWYHLLAVDDRRQFPLTQGYRDFYLLTRYLGASLQPMAYLTVQLVAAAIAAGVCLVGRLRHWPKRHLVNVAFTLGCCWMVVFGPSTESSTFILIAPPLAWAVLEVWQMSRGKWSAPVIVMAMFTLTFMATWFPGGRDWFYILQPLAALMFFVDRLVQSRPRPTPDARHAEMPAESPLAA